MRNLIFILIYVATLIKIADLQVRGEPINYYYSYGGKQTLKCHTDRSNEEDGFFNDIGTKIEAGVKPPNKFTLSYEQHQYILTIYDLDIADEGEYICRRGVTWDVFALYYEDSFGPIVSPQKLFIGVSNTINVTVYSKASPNIEWLRFDPYHSKFVTIAPTPNVVDFWKYSIINNQLRINRMGTDDSGLYKMKIQQNNGRWYTKTFDLIVKEYDGPPTTTNTMETTTTPITTVTTITPNSKEIAITPITTEITAIPNSTGTTTTSNSMEATTTSNSMETTTTPLTTVKTTTPITTIEETTSITAAVTTTPAIAVATTASTETKMVTTNTSTTSVPTTIRGKETSLPSTTKSTASTKLTLISKTTFIPKLTTSVKSASKKNVTSTQKSSLFERLPNEAFMLVGACAGTIVLIIALLTLCWCRRRKRIQQKDNMIRVRDKPIKKIKKKISLDKTKILKDRNLQKRIFGSKVEGLNDAYQFLNKDIQQSLKTVKSQLRTGPGPTKWKINTVVAAAKTANEFQEVRAKLRRKEESQAIRGEEGKAEDIGSSIKKVPEIETPQMKFSTLLNDLQKVSVVKEVSLRPNALNSATENKSSTQEIKELINTTKKVKKINPFVQERVVSPETFNTNNNDLSIIKVPPVKKPQSPITKVLDYVTEKKVQDHLKLIKDLNTKVMVKKVDPLVQENVVSPETCSRDNNDAKSKVSPAKKKRSARTKVLDSTTQEPSKLTKDPNTKVIVKKGDPTVKEEFVAPETSSKDNNDVEIGKVSPVKKKRSPKPKVLDSTTQELSKLTKDPNRTKIVKEVIDPSVKSEKKPKKRKKQPRRRPSAMDGCARPRHAAHLLLQRKHRRDHVDATSQMRWLGRGSTYDRTTRPARCLDRCGDATYDRTDDLKEVRPAR